MTEQEKNLQHQQLREAIAHNLEQEHHWQAERYFWMATTIAALIIAVVTVVKLLT